jgi:hypothetical protein
MAKRKVYRVKYKLQDDTNHHYKYYTACAKGTAETMFRAGFRHTHGDAADGKLVFKEISVKRYGKWKSE